MSEMSEWWYKLIKGLWETHVGKPNKIAHPNRFRGQVRSALDNGYLTIEDFMRMKEEIKKDIELNKLFPFESPKNRLERFHQFEEIVDELLSVWTEEDKG